MADITSLKKDDDDIVTINAGGKIFQILRSTLCLPPGDTAFCKLFGKGSSIITSSVEERMDEDGNFFFDHDPELIEIVLNFLRAKKIEDPFDPIVEAPSIPPKKNKEFRRLLNHFGLTAFFYYPSTIPVTATAAKITDILPVDETPSLETENLYSTRKLSLDGDETASTSAMSKFHESWTSPEDEAITEGFDYCYG